MELTGVELSDWCEVKGDADRSNCITAERTM